MPHSFRRRDQSTTSPTSPPPPTTTTTDQIRSDNNGSAMNDDDHQLTNNNNNNNNNSSADHHSIIDNHGGDETDDNNEIDDDDDDEDEQFSLFSYPSLSSLMSDSFNQTNSSAFLSSSRQFLNNITRFQFPSSTSQLFSSSSLPYQSLLVNHTSNDDHGESGGDSNSGSSHVNIRLQQRQQLGTQHVFYCPITTTTTTTTEEEMGDGMTMSNNDENDGGGGGSVAEHLVTIPLKSGERVLYATRPPIQFSKNILLLFLCALVVVSFVFWVPMHWISYYSRVKLVRYLWLNQFANMILALSYVFIVVYALCFRLLYRRLCTVYAITNKRVIVIEGSHRFEQLLLWIRRQLLKMNPKLSRSIHLLSRCLFGLRHASRSSGSGIDSGVSRDGYSCLSMRDRYGINVSSVDSDDDDNTDQEVEMNLMNEPHPMTSASSEVMRERSMTGNNNYSSSVVIDVDSQEETPSEEKNETRARSLSSLTRYGSEVDMSNYVTSWTFSEIGDLYFMLYHGFKHSNHIQNNNPIAVNSNDCMGSVYFGYKIDAYTLPFTIVTHAVATGFLLVPNVYKVLDILIKQIQIESPHAPPQARLVRSKNDSAVRSHIISRTYACCGLEICFCCPEDDVRGRSQRTRSTAVLGKITQEDYRNLTVNYTLM